eukprot:CAMPEP_0182550144 /NCGR_PEP_ID=MMETSP1323-20130603/41237_1 /TAXON_ID=236787 /ORGANISM="Florenciella parvula, Strain RCC1693" /LENGTH=56 /DNA_ID=CAMNT_0024761651 /DNA_START=26 /DNA_END=193 /DNA_ORIENTATION=-
MASTALTTRMEETSTSDEEEEPLNGVAAASQDRNWDHEEGMFEAADTQEVLDSVAA